MSGIKKIKIIVLFIICIICAFLTIIFGYKILTWHTDNIKTEKIMNKINMIVTKNENDDLVDITGLRRINSEVVGWLKVENTNIDYPIVQTSNNDFYLKHSFDKSNNNAGWIFADCRNMLDGNDRNIVIYGHNRRDGSMFGTLKNALSKEIKIYFVDNKKVIKYEPFSVYTIEKENYYLKTDFNDDSEFEQFLDKITQRSIKKFDINVLPQDSILTLSTCADNNEYRVVVHAKKIIE